MSEIIVRHNDEWHMLFEKLKAENQELDRKLGIAEACLRKISLNRTDEGSIYTMGCDCHDEAKEALAQIGEGE